jgi:hypothetical protein
MVLHYFVRPLLGFIYISSYYLSVMTLVFQQGYFVVCVLVLINVVTLVLFFFYMTYDYLNFMYSS